MIIPQSIYDELERLKRVSMNKPWVTLREGSDDPAVQAWVKELDAKLKEIVASPEYNKMMSDMLLGIFEAPQIKRKRV